MTTRQITVMAAACLVMFGAGRQASAQYGPAVSVKFAIDPSIGGTVHDGGNGLIGGQPATIEAQSWTDTHASSAPLFVVGADFPLAGLLRSLINLEYGRVGADTVDIGTLAGTPLVAQFDRYQFWGLEGGARVGGATGAYAIGTVGFRQVSAMRITATTSTAAGIGRADFYDKSTVPSFGFGGGFMFGAVGFEVMAKYAGALDPAEGASVLPPGVASAGERWSLPIAVVIRF